MIVLYAAVFKTFVLVICLSFNVVQEMAEYDIHVSSSSLQYTCMYKQLLIAHCEFDLYESKLTALLFFNPQLAVTFILRDSYTAPATTISCNQYDTKEMGIR